MYFIANEAIIDGESPPPPPINNNEASQVNESGNKMLEDSKINEDEKVDSKWLI